MNLSQQLVHKQTQRLVMTHDLRQSIELLPLSNLELSEKIQSELIENPLLEEVLNLDKPQTPEMFSLSEVRNIEKEKSLKDNDLSWHDILSNSYRKASPDAADKNQKFIEASPRKQSLTDHLNSQLRLMNLTEDELSIGEILISMLDERGFFPFSYEEISKELHIELDLLKKILSQIQLLEPYGIGARNVRESLLIQARQIEGTDTTLYRLIDGYFSDIEKMDFKKIIRSMKITEEELKVLLENIVKKFDPYPASLFVTKRTDYITPDVIVKENEHEFIIIINDEWMPKLSINQLYKNQLSKTNSVVDKEYISTKLNSANWLIRSIEQRRQTLHRVVNSIIESQIDFFRGGIQNIKPLTLKDIAEKLGVHESTISRITTNKYVETSWGIFELKWFFSSGVRSSEGGKESSKKIHDIIKQLIKEEDTENPLSDQDIVEKVAEKGIEIARRTVAKYRKFLKILPSNRRKRLHSFKD
jgi:RNA polymerase sigma-54 factor